MQVGDLHEPWEAHRARSHPSGKLFSRRDDAHLREPRPFNPGVADTSGSALYNASIYLSTITTIMFIGVMFTVPLALSLVGRAGARIKHVASRSVEPLGLSLLFSFAVFLVGSASSGFAFTLGGIGSGFETALVVSLIAVVILAIVLPSSLLQGMGAILNGSTTGLTAATNRLLSGTRKDGLATIELRAAPVQQLREKDKPERIRAGSIRFERLVQGLAGLNYAVEFRLRFGEGRGRILLHARCRSPEAAEVQQRLLAVVKSYLPDYSAAVVQDAGAPDPEPIQQSLLVTGVPEAVENPLEPISSYFLQNGYSGEYKVVIERARANPFHRLHAKREQKKLAEDAGQQLTNQSMLQNEQRSTATRDRIGEVKLEESLKLVERNESAFALRCQVFVTGRAKTLAEASSIVDGAVSVLMGSLSSHRSISALKVSKTNGGTGGFEPWARHALLLPKEVVPFVWVPQIALGTELAPPGEFELPPKLEGEIELGNIVVHSSTTSHHACIPVDMLTKHCFLTGMTGSGKTTSCFSILVQLYQLGIPFLVIEPVKSEYRSLLTHIPGLQVFTLGDENTAPFRLNIFEPPKDVKIQTHLDNLDAAWNASFVMYSPLPYIVKQVLAETYAACGWDIAKNTRGNPITLDDFRVQTEKVSQRLGYEPKVVMDIEASLKTRIASLSLGGKGPMFNTLASIPMDDLLRRPTVIELKNIQNNEEKAFVAALLMMDIAEYIERKGASKQLRHLTLIEEAHRLLPNISSQKGDPESADPRKKIVEQFADMLAEVRAFGEGLAIVEQIPTKIIPDAIKNTATKVAHRVPAADDREVLAGAMNLSKRQAVAFTGLEARGGDSQRGEAPVPHQGPSPGYHRQAGPPVGADRG